MRIEIVLLGIILIVVGIAFTLGFAATSHYLNTTISPTQATTLIGHYETQAFGPIGPLLIVIGFVITIFGLFVD